MSRLCSQPCLVSRLLYLQIFERSVIDLYIFPDVVIHVGLYIFIGLLQVTVADY